MVDDEPASVSTALARRLRGAIEQAGGWLPFERFMHTALYEPGLGYYARGDLPFGWLPNAAGGSDFVTAPELSPFFARALAVQVAQGLRAVQPDGAAEVLEFGAGSGALAAQLLDALDALGVAPSRYTIVEVSGGLRARQRERLVRFGDRVTWADRLPESIRGVVIGNEVLDAMPVRLLAFDGQAWHERGVVVGEASSAPTARPTARPLDRPLDRPLAGQVAAAATPFAFADRPTPDRPPVDGPWLPGTVTEIHPQARAFVATVAERLQRGLALFIDYGFPEAEYYHPQRSGGTLMCHRAHQVDADPLRDVGLKDITAHVDFTGIALAAQDAGLDVLGYTSQGRFLLNCGIAELLQDADLRERAAAQKLLTEHEMGELFKVIALGRNLEVELVGFTAGDRTHRL
jgi:SAM-dependent MidA family methyltransferase